MTGEGSIVRKLAGMLNRIERLIITLHYSDELTPQEIGCVLDMTEGEVRWVLERVGELAKGMLASRRLATVA